MQRRLLLVLLVFVAGFGVGYGITWLLVGSSGRDADTSRRGGRDEAPATEPVAGSGAPDAASPLGDTAATNAAPDTTVASAAGDTAASATADATPAATPDSGAASAEVAAGETAVVAAKAPWEACHMHVCRLDFGRVTGGISIRKGALEHGQEVVWDRDFGKADKVGTLDAGRDVRVEVLAVGLQDGKPAAAYIVRKTKRDELKGVIALRIGDKSLELKPVEE